MGKYSNDPFLDAIIGQFAGQNPTADYYNFYGPQIKGSGSMARYLQGSQGQVYNGFLGQLLNQPDLTFRDYLGSQNLQEGFQNLTPQQRGERGSMGHLLYKGFPR